MKQLSLILLLSSLIFACKDTPKEPVKTLLYESTLNMYLTYLEFLVRICFDFFCILRQMNKNNTHKIVNKSTKILWCYCVCDFA